MTQRERDDARKNDIADTMRRLIEQIYEDAAQTARENDGDCNDVDKITERIRQRAREIVT